MNRRGARAPARGFTLLEVVIAVVIVVAISALVLPGAVRRAAAPPEEVLIDVARDAVRHARAAAVRAGVPAVLAPNSVGGSAVIEVSLAEPPAEEDAAGEAAIPEGGDSPGRGAVRFALPGFAWSDEESEETDDAPLAVISPDGLVIVRASVAGLRGRSGAFWLRFDGMSGEPTAGAQP